MNDVTEQIGKIVAIENDKAWVSIYSKSACFSCDIKNSCNLLSVTSEKIIEANVKNDYNYFVGQQVKLTMKESQGLKSVLYAYLFPLVIMITGMVVFNSLFHNDGLTGLVAIAVLVVYFLILSGLKKFLGKSFTVNIEPYEDYLRFINQLNEFKMGC